MGANGSELQLVRSSLNPIQMTDGVELEVGCGGLQPSELFSATFPRPDGSD
jgi:hypothetical protein